MKKLEKNVFSMSVSYSGGPVSNLSPKVHYLIEIVMAFLGFSRQILHSDLN
jgi:hypothetical protein